MSRWKASAIHLCVSALVASTLAAILALTWYPPAYVRAVGGLGLIAILAGVDVTLGPLLTLIVWKVGKPSLRFDMAVIILLQLSALGYGLHTVFLARPVYMVFSADRFDLVTAAEIPEGEKEKAKREEFQSLPLAGPKIVAAQRPTDAGERTKIMFSAISGGADLPQLPQYYVSYAELSAEAVRKALPLDSLMGRGAETRDTLTAYLQSHHLDPSKVKFLPLRAKQHDQTVLVDAATGAVLGIVNIDPWQQ